MTAIKAYKVTTVAAMLSSSERTILREITKGKLHAFRVGVQWRVLHDDLEGYVEMQRIPIPLPQLPGWSYGNSTNRPHISPEVQRVLNELDKPIKRRKKKQSG
jgi:excisionase family DNA binding protein